MRVTLPFECLGVNSHPTNPYHIVAWGTREIAVVTSHPDRPTLYSHFPVESGLDSVVRSRSSFGKMEFNLFLICRMVILIML